MKSNTLKELREESKLTQEQVAEKAGVTKDYISMLERGKRRPSDKLKGILAKIYSVTEVQIFLATQRTISTTTQKEEW